MVNVLAVTLGAIFNEDITTVHSSVALVPLRNASLTRATLIPFSGSADYNEHFYVTLTNLSHGVRLPPWFDSRFAYLPFARQSMSSADATLEYQAETRGFGFEPNCAPLSVSPDNRVFANVTSIGGESTPEYAFFVHIKTAEGVEVQCELNRPNFFSNVSGPSSTEIFSAMNAREGWVTNKYNAFVDGGVCGQVLAAAWMRNNSQHSDGEMNMTAVYCQPVLRTAMFNVTVDSNGHVLSSEFGGTFDEITAFMAKDLAESLAAEASNLIGAGLSRIPWHNDTLTRDWPNYLLAKALNSSRLVDPAQPLPSSNEAVSLVDDLYRRLGAALLGVDRKLFATAESPSPIQGTALVLETRIFMNEVAYILSLAILALTLLVGAIFYLKERDFYLPRLPTSIGSLIAYVAAGRAVSEHHSPRIGINLEDAERSPSTYSFGSFMGIDGRPHVGIEQDPYVVPLRSSMTGAIPRRWKSLAG
jgi:hypothetical protein